MLELVDLLFEQSTLAGQFDEASPEQGLFSLIRIEFGLPPLDDLGRRKLNQLEIGD